MVFPVGWCVPAGPQDASVRDAGHAGHWAQRVIEASPVQNRIRQDRMGGGEVGGTRTALRKGEFCLFSLSFGDADVPPCGESDRGG